MMTGRQVKSDEAFRIGLADEVVEPEQLHVRALELASELARGALQAQRLIKSTVDNGASMALQDGLLLERDVFEQVFYTQDSQIGVASFRQSGPGNATFTGK